MLNNDGNIVHCVILIFIEARDSSAKLRDEICQNVMLHNMRGGKACVKTSLEMSKIEVETYVGIPIRDVVQNKICRFKTFCSLSKRYMLGSHHSKHQFIFSSCIFFMDVPRGNQLLQLSGPASLNEVLK